MEKIESEEEAEACDDERGEPFAAEEGEILVQFPAHVNYLAAELRGMLRLSSALKESRLALVMSGVPFALVLHILLYDVGRCVLTDGVCIIAFRPELTAPQHPLDLGVVYECLFCSNAFDGLYDVAWRCCGDGLYEQVDVVVVCANFDEVDIIPVLYFKTDFLECLDDTVGQYFPAILDGAYEVVQETGFVVALLRMTVLHATNIHLTSLPPQQSCGAICLV